MVCMPLAEDVGRPPQIFNKYSLKISRKYFKKNQGTILVQ